jgi:hypothetical protein
LRAPVGLWALRDMLRRRMMLVANRAKRTSRLPRSHLPMGYTPEPAAQRPLGKNRPAGRYKGGMSNPLRPDLMTPAERLAEIAEILAAGLIRLRARQSSPLSPDSGESSLDCYARRSGHANALTREGGLD